MLLAVHAARCPCCLLSMLFTVHAAAVVVADRSTSTYRVVSIGRQKCCWVVHMTWPLICGVLAVYLLKCTLVSHCLLAPVRYVKDCGFVSFHRLFGKQSQQRATCGGGVSISPHRHTCPLPGSIATSDLNDSSPQLSAITVIENSIRF